MDSSILIAIGGLLTVIGTVWVSVNKSKSETKASNIAGEFAMSDRLEKYIERQETRLARMEKEKEEADWRFATLRNNFEDLSKEHIEIKSRFNELRNQLEAVKLENQRLTLDNEAKIGRIGTLESQVIDLQAQLDNYKHIDGFCI